MRKVKKYFINAIILTLTALFMRTVSVGFNVYISNRVGAEAMGLFSLISGVYGFALTLATSGINLAVTRLISAEPFPPDSRRIKGIMKNAIMYCLFFGGAAAFLLWTFSGTIGMYILDDTRTVKCLKIFAVSLPMISVSSALNGYFTAVRRVYKNAIVGIAEQWCKIISISLLLGILMPRGIEYACIALVLGGTASEVLSCIVMAILWLYEKSRIFSETPKNSFKKPSISEILGISLPVALSSYARSALITVEHSLIPRGLKRNGIDHAAALATYGTIHSMALPIVLFPSAFISSFSGLLVPELSEYKAQHNDTEIRYIASRVFQFTLIFSIGAAGIMICFSELIGEVIYPGKGTGRYISVFAPLIPIMYLDSTVDAMLKGLGHQVYSMNVNIIDSALSVALVYILIPRLGISGYIVTIFITEILNSTLSIVKLLESTGVKVKIFRWICLPLSCICGASSAVRILAEYAYFSQKINKLATCITASILLYIVLLVMIRSVTSEDIKWMRNIFKSEKSPRHREIVRSLTLNK